MQKEMQTNCFYISFFRGIEKYFRIDKLKLYMAFKRATGLTPQAYRKKHQKA